MRKTIRREIVTRMVPILGGGKSGDRRRKNLSRAGEAGWKSRGKKIRKENRGDRK